jgi:hypothetical protein
MLPAWAAVLIAFAAAFGGVVAALCTLYATARTIRHEQSEAWRARLIDAAYDFGDNWTKYSNFCQFTYENNLAFRDLADQEIEKIAEDEQRLHTPTSNSVIRVKVLFGDDSTAGNEADRAFHTAVEMAQLMREGLRADSSAGRQAAWDRALEAGKAADASYVRFNRAAHLAIRPKRGRSNAKGRASRSSPSS